MSPRQVKNRRTNFTFRLSTSFCNFFFCCYFIRISCLFINIVRDLFSDFWISKRASQHVIVILWQYCDFFLSCQTQLIEGEKKKTFLNVAETTSNSRENNIQLNLFEFLQCWKKNRENVVSKLFQRCQSLQFLWLFSKDFDFKELNREHDRHNWISIQVEPRNCDCLRKACKKRAQLARLHVVVLNEHTLTHSEKKINNCRFQPPSSPQTKRHSPGKLEKYCWKIARQETENKNNKKNPIITEIVDNQRKYPELAPHQWNQKNRFFF